MASLQYSDTTNKLGIIQGCETLCNLGDAGISGNSYLKLEFTRHINKTGSNIWSWINDVYGGWVFSDSNNSDLDIATDTLTADQQDYALPTDAHAVRGIEIKDTAGNWFALKPLTEEMVRNIEADSQYLSTSGIPEYYRLMGDTVRMYPPANYTQASSFRVYYTRGMVAFASTATTTTPGIPSTFHDAYPVGASIEYLKVHKPDSRILQELKNEFDNPNNPNSWYNRIRKFYTKRFAEMFPPRLTVNDAVKEYE